MGDLSPALCPSLLASLCLVANSWHPWPVGAGILFLSKLERVWGCRTPFLFPGGLRPLTDYRSGSIKSQLLCLAVEYLKVFRSSPGLGWVVPPRPWLATPPSNLHFPRSLTVPPGATSSMTHLHVILASGMGVWETMTYASNSTGQFATSIPHKETILGEIQRHSNIFQKSLNQKKKKENYVWYIQLCKTIQSTEKKTRKMDIKILPI